MVTYTMMSVDRMVDSYNSMGGNASIQNPIKDGRSNYPIAEIPIIRFDKHETTISAKRIGTRCDGCGAPYRGATKCEYCGGVRCGK